LEAQNSVNHAKLIWEFRKKYSAFLLKSGWFWVKNQRNLPVAKNEKRHSFGVPFSVNPDEIILLKSS
jgi:hypothetical protein